MDGPSNAVIPKRKKEGNNGAVEGCGLGDIAMPKQLEDMHLEADTPLTNDCSMSSQTELRQSS
jgi:hypothetical protein